MTAIIVIVVVVILAAWLVSMYNSLVKMRNNRENAFADIDVQLKQRHDLVPQLVETVKGYAAHEKDTLERVINARNGAIGAKTIDEKIVAENALSSALSGLKITLEAYPDLKANQNFLELQAQLEGTENRINVARKNFNDAAQAYNTNIRRFPKNIFAGMFGFDKKAYFEAEEGSEKAPKVEF